jgi:transcriptional regulator with XRE-family HTH domain
VIDIGKKIREIRKANGQKLLNISEATGLSQPFISEIERGVKVPSIDTLEKICSALGITLSEFFSDQSPELPPHLRNLVEAARDLSPEQVELLTDLIRKFKTKGE